MSQTFGHGNRRGTATTHLNPSTDSIMGGVEAFAEGAGVSSCHQDACRRIVGLGKIHFLSTKKT